MNITGASPGRSWTTQRWRPWQPERGSDPPQQHQAVAIDGDRRAGPVGDAGSGGAVGRVELDAPQLPPPALRQEELERLVVGVEQDQKAVVDHSLASGVWIGDLLAVEEDAQRQGVALVPVFVAHLLAVGPEPADVGQAAAPDGPA